MEAFKSILSSTRIYLLSENENVKIIIKFVSILIQSRKKKLINILFIYIHV